jgi:hypothetical protein
MVAEKDVGSRELEKDKITVTLSVWVSNQSFQKKNNGVYSIFHKQNGFRSASTSISDPILQGHFEKPP